MNRILLTSGGLLSFLLALFKIAMPYLFHWREAIGASAASMWATLYAENLGIFLFLAMAVVYLLPLITRLRTNPDQFWTHFARRSVPGGYGRSS